MIDEFKESIDQIEKYEQDLNREVIEAANYVSEHSMMHYGGRYETTELLLNNEQAESRLENSITDITHVKALLEKEIKEKEKARERKKAEEERKRLIEEIEQQAKEEAKEKYQNLSEEEREEYLTGFDELPDFLDTTEEEYIIGSIKDEMEKEIKRKEGII